MRDAVLTLDRAVARREEWKRSGLRVVFTNGCFVLLHRGHLDLLTGARDLGDVLLVGINGDASVRRLKGEGRPLVPAEDRAALVAGLKPVDAVVVFDEDTPGTLLEVLRPEVLVKGGDYGPGEVVGREIVEAYGGRIHVLPFREGCSTTGLLARLRGEG